MNWKTEAAEKLRCYDAMRQAVVNLTAEITQLETEAVRLRSGLTGKRTPIIGGCSLRDLLLSNQVHQRELTANLQRTGCWLENIDRALGALTPEEKLILYRMYIYPERGSVDRLCGDLNVEQSSIYRKREKALRKFTYALYGIGEN